jgi:hypothetical protein
MDWIEPTNIIHPNEKTPSIVSELQKMVTPGVRPSFVAFPYFWALNQNVGMSCPTISWVNSGRKRERKWGYSVGF